MTIWDGGDASEAGPQALAQWSDTNDVGRANTVFRDYTDPNAQQALLLQATRAIENRCDRRLVPFTGLYESQRAMGIDQGILAGSDMPLDLSGALGRSQALAFASTRMVRDIWLRQYAPRFEEYWTYDVTQIQLVRAYGDTELVPPTSVEGPEPDSGHIRFRLGTFVPEGTTIRVTYDGGYDPIPADLTLACCYQAAKYAVLGAEPETRKDMSLVELDAEILSLIAPYIR